MATFTTYETSLIGTTPITVQDRENGGTGTVSGTVTVKGTPTNIPVARKVFLIRERDMQPSRVMMSDPLTGAYSFNNVSKDYVYTVVSYDDLTSNRAVIADGIVAV